jgi:hypothetical protein
MQASQVLSTGFLVHGVIGSIVQAVSSIARFAAAGFEIVRRRCRREDLVASSYAGRSWGDSTEREMTNDVTSWGCTRF